MDQFERLSLSPRNRLISFLKTVINPPPMKAKMPQTTDIMAILFDVLCKIVPASLALANDAVDGGKPLLAETAEVSNVVGVVSVLLATAAVAEDVPEPEPDAPSTQAAFPAVMNCCADSAGTALVSAQLSCTIRAELCSVSQPQVLYTAMAKVVSHEASAQRQLFSWVACASLV
jgi:hypothetical protein